MLVFLFVVSGAQARGTWSISSSVQATQGSYIFDTSTMAVYVYSGLRYRTRKWNLSASLPMVAQNNDRVTRTGGMFLPTGQVHHSEGQSGTPHHGGSMTGSSTTTSELKVAMGDLYLYGELELFSEWFKRTSVSLGAQMKFPTASPNTNYGTGEFDYGLGLSVRKRSGSFAGFADIGFLAIGDPDGVTYRDPVTVGGGLGRVFGKGRFSFLLYYQRYSRILPGYDPPREVSVGLSVKLNSRSTVSLMGLSGLSETSPDVSVSGGLEWTL
ncbi:MAG: hypothetical protein ACE5GH_07070 [Fidelibacterota bacterium]